MVCWSGTLKDQSKQMHFLTPQGAACDFTADVNTLKVPDNLPDEKVIFLSDIMPTGWHATEMGQVGKGDRWALPLACQSCCSPCTCSKTVPRQMAPFYRTISQACALAKVSTD